MTIQFDKFRGTKSKNPEVSIPLSLLSKAFPYLIAWDNEGRIKEIGRALHRLCPEMETGCLLAGVAHFRYAGGDKGNTLSVAQPTKINPNNIAIIENIKTSRLFRGPIIVLEGLEVMMAQPWITEPSQLRQHGLGYANLGLHDQALELQYIRVLLETLLRTSPDGLLLADAHGRICMSNKALDEMMGYENLELVGKPVETLIPKPYHDIYTLWKEDYLHAPQPRQMGSGIELEALRKDGKRFPIDASLVPFRIGDELFVQATIADISIPKRAERVLRINNANLEDAVEMRTAELRAASAAKSEFLANMSHEIRTPLNSILGLAQLLENENVTQNQQRMVSQIRQSGQLLLGIINDILDLSKIEAGHVRLDVQPFQLKEIIARARAVLSSAAAAKNLQLHFSETVYDTKMLLGDTLRVQQVLINLISNAIKFTEKGVVSLRIDNVAQQSEDVRLRFVVKDTGIGIAKEKLESVFDAFSQADASIGKKYGGTGLGLSISKKLVVQMGGEIGVISEPNEGSEFWFELPFEMQKETNVVPLRVPAQVHGPRLAGLRFLVVDDSRMNREVVERMLVREGAFVALAGDGLQALQLLKVQPEGFDAVLMDIQMPIMDGLTATRAIREELRLVDLPVIALTAGVLPEQRAQIKDVGCNDFIPKPVDLDDLVQVLKKSVAPKPVEAVVEAPKVESLTFPDILGLNTTRAARLLNNDRGHFLMFLKNFAEEFGRAPEQVRTCLKNGERDAAAKKLHALRGTAGYIGAETLSECASQLETAILENSQSVEVLLERYSKQHMALLNAIVTSL
jgi:PAS domain S-box-containing protein